MQEIALHHVPQAPEAENYVLGVLLLHPDSILEVISLLSPESFVSQQHQYIYRAMAEIYASGEQVNLISVKNQLRKTHKLEAVGGAFYLTELTTYCTSSSLLLKQAVILVEMHLRRKVLGLNNFLNKAGDYGTDIFDFIEDFQQKLLSFSESITRSNFVPIRTSYHDVLVDHQNNKSKNGLSGIPSGFTELDRITHGWQAGDLIIVAARPGMGKTAFIISCLRNAGIQFNHKAALFSLEMENKAITERMISAEAEIDLSKFKGRTLEEADFDRIMNKASGLATDNILLVDNCFTLQDFCTQCRRLKRQLDAQREATRDKNGNYTEEGLGLIILDYLQLMEIEGVKLPTREQEISYISRKIKLLAKELGIPIIALSQLSRAVETRGGTKKPVLSDLRESGSIEQDADIVIFIYRAEYYNITEDENGESVKGIAEIIVEKNRQGGRETAKIKFIGKYTKFIDINAFPINYRNVVDTFLSNSTETDIVPF